MLRPTLLTRTLLCPRTFSRPSSRSVAKITLVGRLADTPELIKLPSGREKINYALATSTGMNENRKTSWWNVQVFSDNKEYAKYLTGMGKG